MQKNSQNFSMEEAMRLANTDAGQRLMAILKQSDTGQLQKAMDMASAGNYKSMEAALSSLLASPDVQALLKELGG